MIRLWIHGFVIGVGIGGLITTYIVEHIYKKYDAGNMVIDAQQDIIDILAKELDKKYEKMEDDLK